MAYNRIQAKRICTVQEYDLFESSFSDRKGGDALTLEALRARRQRTRNLRDKYRDLLKRQRLANRERTGSKKGDRADGNRRTEQKVQLFAEALARFDQRIAALEAADRKAANAGTAGKPSGEKSSAKKPSTSKLAGGKAPSGKTAGKKASGKKKARKGKGGFISEKAQAATRRGKKQNTRSKAVMGHTRAAGRRRQARRDSGGKK